MTSQVAYLALVGLAATLVSQVLSQRDAAIARLAEQRGQLATHALTAEQRERRRLAELLHDASVQTLSVARQELVDYHRTGRDAPSSVHAARSTRRWRSCAGRSSSSTRMCSTTPGCRRRSARWPTGAPVGWAPRSASRSTRTRGRHDELIVFLARELLSNAVKHSGAAHVGVTVAADSERVELEVRDDGRGFDPSGARPRCSRATSAWRRRAQCSPAGGELVVQRAGNGTTVQATLPLAASAVVTSGT